MELAVAHGAQASAVPFAESLFTWGRNDRRLPAAQGADPVSNLPFVDASTERIRTALGADLFASVPG